MKIMFIGAGGHAKSCKHVVENATKKINILGYIEKNIKINKDGFNIIGVEKDLLKLRKKFKCENLLNAIGYVRSPKNRNKVYKNCKKLGFNFPKVISKTATICEKVLIKDGTIIMNNVFVNSNTQIEENCIINTGVILEHDVLIKKNCHIAPGAVINGGDRKSVV